MHNTHNFRGVKCYGKGEESVILQPVMKEPPL